MILALLLISAPLTLEEAVSEALRQNETPALVRQQIVSSEAEKRRALARVLPSFDVLGSYTRRLRTATPGGSAVRVANALNAQMNLQSRVVDAPSIPLLQAAGDDLEQTLAAGEDEIRNFAFDVAQAFYAVLASEGLIEAAVERVQLAEVTVNDSRSRFQAGLAGRGDVNRSALELTTARLDLTDLQNVLVQAKLTLGFLIGRPLKESLSPEVHPLVPSGSVQELIAQARRDRPDVEAARYALRAAARRAFEPWLRLVPSVDLLGQLTFTNETGFQGRTLDGSLQLLAVWNLYDGGIRYADRKGFGAEREQRRLELERLERTVELEIRSALADLDRARAAVRQAEDRVRVAELNAEDTREQFNSGLATALEQADANVELFEARAAREEARFSLSVAELELGRRVGANPPGYRAPGDQQT